MTKNPHKQIITNAGTYVEKEKSKSCSLLVRAQIIMATEISMEVTQNPKNWELEHGLNSQECTLLCSGRGPQVCHRTYVRRLTTTYHSSSIGLNTLFQPLQVLAQMYYIERKDCDSPNDQHLGKGWRRFFLLLLTTNYHTLASICRQQEIPYTVAPFPFLGGK